MTIPGCHVTIGFLNTSLPKGGGHPKIVSEKLGRVNLFVGVNNSGKTSVLEAISLHCNPLNALEWINTARRRYVESSGEHDLDAVRWLFPQHHADQEDEYYKGEVRVEAGGKYPNLESRAYYNGIVGTPDEAEIEDAEPVDREVLKERKQKILTALKNLEKDFEDGIISKESYNEIKAKYRQEAINVMKKLDK